MFSEDTKDKIKKKYNFFVTHLSGTCHCQNLFGFRNNACANTKIFSDKNVHIS